VHISSKRPTRSSSPPVTRAGFSEAAARLRRRDSFVRRSCLLETTSDATGNSTAGINSRKCGKVREDSRPTPIVGNSIPHRLPTITVPLEL